MASKHPTDLKREGLDLCDILGNLGEWTSTPPDDFENSYFMLARDYLDDADDILNSKFYSLDSSLRLR